MLQPLTALHPLRHALLCLGALGLLLAPACKGSSSTVVPAATQTLVITAFQPASAQAGDVVTLTGTGFTGVSLVTFGGHAAQAWHENSDQELLVTVPAIAATGPIAVKTTSGLQADTAPAVFTLIAPPLAATGFTPASGPVGTVVAIHGTNLGQATSVTFGGTAAVLMTVATDNQSIAATIPAGAVTGPVLLHTPAGDTPVAGGDFTVTAMPALPSVTAFEPASAGPGQVLTLTGQGFTGTSQVTFGGHPAAAWTVLSDLQLQVTVPANAATGPLTVTTPAGTTSTFPALFTLLLHAPVITSFEPAQGVPGTEVVLLGDHFEGASEVTYAGVPLGPDRFQAANGFLRVWVPDDATTNGVIGVVNPGGAAETALPFTVVPSRRASLREPFATQPGPFGEGRYLDLPVKRRTEQYQQNFPQAPMFHAYHPDAGGLGRKVFGNTETNLNFKLPSTFYAELPPAIKGQIEALGLPPDSVDILCTSQDYFYDGVSGADGIYLFRPHYWLDPDAPYLGLFTHNFGISAGFYEADPGVTVDGQAPGVFFPFDVTVHSESGTAISPIVSSAATQPVAGFDVTRSTGLWSLTLNGTRAAATLHLLFNDADQEVLKNLTVVANDLTGLVTGFNGGSLRDTRGVQLFKQLLRPEILMTADATLPSGERRLTLTGTCLAGATQITVNGLPVRAFLVRSDAVLEVTVPAGTTGNLVVTTPLGESRPLLL
jgi:hypothetical protein